MRERFSIEQPKDTGDDRVTFIINFNGTVLPGFIPRDVLVGIGGLTSNNLVSLFTQHQAVIAQAVRRKLPAPLMQYISIGTGDLI